MLSENEWIILHHKVYSPPKARKPDHAIPNISEVLPTAVDNAYISNDDALVAGSPEEGTPVQISYLSMR